MDKEQHLASEQRLMQYMGDRFGQRRETHQRYDEAIKACSSIDYLDKTISDIARLFVLTTEALRNQLKRHFPEVIPNRDKLRQLLGLAKMPARGLKPSTEAKYAPAIAMLHNATVTINEAAEKCNVSLPPLRPSRGDGATPRGEEQNGGSTGDEPRQSKE